MYFDYTATTKMDEEILKLYINVQEKYYANTTSLHKFGQKCNYYYEKMQAEINSTLGVDNKVIFTTNATEANNLAIFGLIGDKTPNETNKYKVITTKIEHPSVFEVFKHLETKGFDVCYLDVDSNGLIDLDMLEKELNKDTILVSIMWVNNIIGSIQPINEVIKLMKKYPKAKLHVDAVQGICKIKPDFSFEDIDAFTMSAHKFYGPKGIGVLLYKKNIKLEPRLFGSTSQEGIKPGTFDLGLVICCAKALSKFYKETDKHFQIVKKLNERLVNSINNPKVIINSNNKCTPYIVNISIPSILGETIVHIFEEKELYVSTGSACSSKLQKPEKTILAITNDEQLAKSTVRISLSHLTTNEELDVLINTINNI